MLQAQTLPDEAPVGKIHPFSKIAVTHPSLLFYLDKASIHKTVDSMGVIVLFKVDIQDGTICGDHTLL